jgi:hypothetical protein
MAAFAKGWRREQMPKKTIHIVGGKVMMWASKLGI